ncbi:MAG: hypothetical protein HC902_09375 [Calothrix sp. SM1_5_4]|nr:hypothetical protein [Calothrix sp. SM1_5_4]
MLYMKNGFSIISVLIALAIGGAGAILFADLIAAQVDGVRLATRIQEKIEFETQVIRTLTDNDVCSCQLSAELNSSLASRLTVDESLSSPPDIDLGQWRSNCDFSAPSAVIAEAGTTAANMKYLVPSSIKLRNIHKIDNGRYSSQLTIDYAASIGELPLTPSVINIGFAINTSAGSSSARPITNCLGKKNEEILNDCPSGMELIGTAGTAIRFVIDIDERPAKNYNFAEADCNAQRYQGGPRLFVTYTI